MFVSNALIGLREGLEAGIVVMVIVAFLSGWGRREEIRLVWLGVAAALVTSVAVGIGFVLAAARLDGDSELLFETGASACAVLFLTSMIFWMRHSAREERRQIEGKVSTALRVGPIAVLAVAFIAVLREGLEAAIFVLVLSESGGVNAAQSVSGLLTGAAIAVVLSWMLHAGLIRINMAKFLTFTGLLLTVIAAGIMAHLVEALQQLDVVPGADTIAFDATAILPDGSWYGHFVHGLLGLSGHPTVLALVAWATYLVAILTLFLRLALRVPAISDGEQQWDHRAGRRLDHMM